MRLLPNNLFRTAALASVCTALALPAAASATTIHVDAASVEPAATCGLDVAPCASIEDALTHAASGDILALAPGEHDGATISTAVQLRGPQAGINGVSRGATLATSSARIVSPLIIQASVTIDGLDFRPATGPAIQFAAALPGAGAPTSLVTNSTFAEIGGSQVVYAATELDSLTFTDNLFVGQAGGAHVALFLHGEFVPNRMRGVTIERNEFRGFAGHAEAAAIDAGGVPGMHVRANTVFDSGALLLLSDTNGSLDRVVVSDNIGSRFTSHAIQLGGGVRALTIERNRIAGGSAAALRISDARGTGRSSDIRFRANDVTGTQTAVSAAGDVLDDALVLRGNRIITASAQNVIVTSLTSGSVDARRNWWGRNSGLPSTALNGPADASEPLQLVGVTAPAAVFTGGSGVVSVRLVAAGGTEPDVDAAGFPVTFTTTNATLDASSVTFAFGSASTLFTAGAAPGATTTVATLDAAQVSATTQIVASGAPLSAGSAEPSSADTSAPARSGFTASVRRAGNLARALTAGLSQVVVTNRPASVRTTYVVSHYTAKLLGLRGPRSATREPFIIAKARTRAVRGRRVVTVDIRTRPRFAIARYGKRIEVYVITHVRARDGVTRTVNRRFVLPATRPRS